MFETNICQTNMFDGMIAFSLWRGWYPLLLPRLTVKKSNKLSRKIFNMCSQGRELEQV